MCSFGLGRRQGFKRTAHSGTRVKLREKDVGWGGLQQNFNKLRCDVCCYSSCGAKSITVNDSI